jgi:hypothetical protein
MRRNIERENVERENIERKNVERNGMNSQQYGRYNTLIGLFLSPLVRVVECVYF